MDSDSDTDQRLEHLRAMPSNGQEIEVTRWLAKQAVQAGIARHAGRVTDLFTPTGKTQIVRGKDLTAVQWIVGTGGALTRVEGGADILADIRSGAGALLLPGPAARVLIDRNYLFSALGTLAQAYPSEVHQTFVDWVSTTIETR